MNNLRSLREKVGVSQQEIATMLGVSRQSYNFYENGKRQAPYEILIKLADYFNTSIDNVLRTDQKAPPANAGSADSELQEVMQLFKDASPERRAVVLAALKAEVQDK